MGGQVGHVVCVFAFCVMKQVVHTVWYGFASIFRLFTLQAEHFLTFLR